MDRKKLINRVNRAEGQLRGIVKMMEEERECRDVVIQLAAVKASVEKIIHIIVTECMIKDGEEVGKEQLEDALDLILKIK